MKVLKQTMSVTVTSLLAYLIIPQYATAQSPACSNQALLEALRIIDRACKGGQCDFDELRALDDRVGKREFLGALKNPELWATHVFFPANDFRLEDSFDWHSFKRDQVASLALMNKPESTAIFILGQASTTAPEGSINGEGDDFNRRKSWNRMQSMLSFLRDDLKLPCKDFRVGWFGREIMQLEVGDAAWLGIPGQDYRSDRNVLNQAVHVFAFPCKELLD